MAIYRVGARVLVPSDEPLPSERGIFLSSQRSRFSGWRSSEPLCLRWFRYGEFFSTLDELAAAEARDLRRRDRCGLTGGDLVLRHAEIHPGRLSADPAGAVPARSARLAARDGLPLLPQFRRCRGAFESSRTPRPAWPATRRCRKIIRSSSRCGRAGKPASRSSGCSFIARPITFFTITPRT